MIHKSEWSSWELMSSCWSLRKQKGNRWVKLQLFILYILLSHSWLSERNLYCREQFHGRSLSWFLAASRLYGRIFSHCVVFGKLKENGDLYCTYVWIGWEWRQCLLRNSTDLKRIAFSSGDKERISLKKCIRSDLIQKSYKLLFKYTTFRRHMKDDKFYSQKPRILFKKYRI